MKLYVPLRIHPDEGVVRYEEGEQVSLHTRPGAILAALELVATFDRLGRAVEVYVQDERQEWHRVSGQGHIRRVELSAAVLSTSTACAAETDVSRPED